MSLLTLPEVVEYAIRPAYALLPRRMDSPLATCMLLAIGLQESRFAYRAQIVKGRPYVKGPARGFWQFEKGGGVYGVMNHPATQKHAVALCVRRKVAWDDDVIHATLEVDDVLAAGFARLLLYSDPAPLPALDADHEIAWDYYERTWRPGKPHRETWDAFHTAARIIAMELEG
jgi:hypothetical protein